MILVVLCLSGDAWQKKHDPDLVWSCLPVTPVFDISVVVSVERSRASLLVIETQSEQNAHDEIKRRVFEGVDDGGHK